MAIKSVVKMGSNQLAMPSAEVTEFSSTYLKELILDMKDTMEKEGGIGIAAPQIGVNLRVIIFGFDDSTRYPEEKAIPFTILINPTIENLSNETVEGWEGCLSVPGLRGYVARYQKIKYTGYNEAGERFSKEVSGFHARVVQHEYDHLEGILYPQRIKDLRLFGFEKEIINRVNQNN